MKTCAFVWWGILTAKIRGTGVPKIPLQCMKFLHVTLDSKSGLQMGINYDDYVKLIDTIPSGN